MAQRELWTPTSQTTIPTTEQCVDCGGPVDHPELYEQCNNCIAAGFVRQAWQWALYQRWGVLEYE